MGSVLLPAAYPSFMDGQKNALQRGSGITHDTTPTESVSRPFHAHYYSNASHTGRLRALGSGQERLLGMTCGSNRCFCRLRPDLHRLSTGSATEVHMGVGVCEGHSCVQTGLFHRTRRSGGGLPVPERVGRVVIHNRTSNMKLVKTFAHLCHGDWTPGGWVPPDTIGPGQTGGMQSESGGVLTGAEGHAKYDVIRDADGRQGMIYVYWDNPWFGVTHPRFATNAVDVHPDCDFQVPPGQSDFYSIDTSLSFYVAPVRYGTRMAEPTSQRPAIWQRPSPSAPRSALSRCSPCRASTKTRYGSMSSAMAPPPSLRPAAGYMLAVTWRRGSTSRCCTTYRHRPTPRTPGASAASATECFSTAPRTKATAPQTADLLGTGNHYARV